MIHNILYFFESIFGDFYFLLPIMTLSFVVKLGLLIYLMGQALASTHRIHRSLFLLMGILIGSLAANAAWILKLFGALFITGSNYSLVINTYIIPAAWLFPVIEYQSLAFFLENLTEKQFEMNSRRLITLSMSFIFFTLSAYMMLSCWFGWTVHPYLASFRELCSLYCLFPLMLTSVSYAIWSKSKKKMPRLVQKQLSIIIKGFIVPHWILNILHLYPFNFSDQFVQMSYAAVGFSALITTGAIFYSARKVVGLRFLNLKKHVAAATRFNFVNSFKDVLEQFSLATSQSELIHISQTFFKYAFDIPLNRTSLYIRNDTVQTSSIKRNADLSATEVIVEGFLSSLDSASHQRLAQEALLITDEIEFSYFYEQDPQLPAWLTFLEAINADIFLPIYKNNSIIAYIIVDRLARPDQFYSEGERDEMLIFSHYSGNMIHLLKSRQLESLIAQGKELKEELYNKHQEINQYKESIRSFLRTKSKEIGIIFYKARKFIFGNQTAQDLIKINPNTQEGHPLTKALKQLAQQVEDYKAPQSSIYTDGHNNKLVISGVANLERNNVIITVYPPDISDIIKKQVDMLKDPSKWDYLLYLETTKSGQLINQLIPGSGETLLNFKIDLLKIALSKKAIVLNMPDEDLRPTVEILHHISLREQLHILSLKGPSASNENAIKLFGISPIFGMNHEKPLLERLDGTGTLFIENIHLLEMEAQDYLAEYLKYGVYNVFKSDQKQSSNVRIICSTHENLSQKVAQGAFSQALFNELKETTIAMPSLLTISEDELHDLAEGFSQTALVDQPFASLLELTEKEKFKLSHARPVSLTELKNRVQNLLAFKSKKNNIQTETQFDPAFELTSPELIQAARLGKHALKDRKTMTLLWSKFQNQNKIAAFLGVNRSSVNRRCKEFNLE